jgi:hypothetical protein
MVFIFNVFFERYRSRKRFFSQSRKGRKGSEMIFFSPRRARSSRSGYRTKRLIPAWPIPPLRVLRALRGEQLFPAPLPHGQTASESRPPACVSLHVHPLRVLRALRGEFFPDYIGARRSPPTFRAGRLRQSVQSSEDSPPAALEVTEAEEKTRRRSGQIRFARTVCIVEAEEDEKDEV